MWDEQEINRVYEEHLDRAWEQYNEEGPDEEYDPWALADEMYEWERDHAE